MKTIILTGTTRVVAEALREAAAINCHSNSLEAKANVENYTALADMIEQGRMILDPWEIDDVYAQAEDLKLTEDQAIEVLQSFSDNDYRTQTGNEMLQDTAYELYAPKEA